MKKSFPVLLLALLTTVPVMAEMPTFEKNVDRLLQRLPRLTSFREAGGEPRDFAALRELAKASDADNHKAAAQALLLEAEGLLAKAQARIDRRGYASARQELREATKLILRADNIQKGLMTFRRVAERSNDRRVERGIDTRDFMSDVLGNFQNNYVQPLKARLEKIYGMIDTIYSAAERAQGAEWAHTGVAYQTKRAKLIPAAFYNISFQDVIPGITQKSEVALGDLGSVEETSTSTVTEHKTVGRLSVQVGMSVNTEPTGKPGDESRIGFLGAGFKLNDTFTFGAGVSAGDGINGVDPYVGATINLFKLF